MGNLWRCCAKVRELIELSFGVVSGVSSGIGVLDGVHVTQREGEVLEVFHVGLLVWNLPLRCRQRNVFGLCEKI